MTLHINRANTLKLIKEQLDGLSDIDSYKHDLLEYFSDQAVSDVPVLNVYMKEGENKLYTVIGVLPNGSEIESSFSKDDELTLVEIQVRYNHYLGYWYRAVLAVGKFEYKAKGSYYIAEKYFIIMDYNCDFSLYFVDFDFNPITTIEGDRLYNNRNSN